MENQKKINFQQYLCEKEDKLNLPDNISPKKRIDIKSITLPELEKIIMYEGFPSFRAKQIFHWLFSKRVDSFKKMSNIPKDLINYLESLFFFEEIDCLKKIDSKDGSQKFLFRLTDDQLIESVLIRGVNRNTICLSSQVGCLWHCLFCASGKGGFKRNLKTGEIVEQLLAIERISGEKVNNIVFMGMGEPFENYEQVIRSINIINDKLGVNIGSRKITISTCGIIPGIERLTKNPLQIELSVSLHAAEDRIRDYLMPVNKRYPLKRLVAACKEYTEEKNRQVTFEYLMLRGINDSPEQAKKLCSLISNLKAKVNLITYNPISKGPRILPSEEKTIFYFQQILKNNHIPVTIRYSKGKDIGAACGQLKNTYLNL